MSHVFISYSRKDIELAQKIVEALAASNLDTWIDWMSIPKGEDWEQEIYRGIEAADAFLFLLSSESVTSEMCSKEIAHAVKNGKRILPIVLRDTKTEEFLDAVAKKEISKRNWIFCREKQDDFNRAVEEIRMTIHTDYEWLKYHTKLQVKALDWETYKDHSRLLRGKELREAQEQLAKVGNQKDPQPTQLQRNYLLTSQRHEELQRRQITTGLGFGLVLVTALAVFAWTQRNTAITERDNANQQSRISRAGQLAALSQNLGEDYPERSLLLAIEAIKATSDAGDIRIPQAEQALRDGLYRLGGIGLSGHETSAMATAFSPDKKWLATGSVDGNIQLYDLSNSEIAKHPIVFTGHRDGVTALAFSPDSHWLATGGGTDMTDLFRESGSTNSLMGTLAALTRRGNEITVRQPDTQIRIWNLGNLDPNQDPILLSGPTREISTLAFSPDGRWFASSSFDGTIQLWELKNDVFASAPKVLRDHKLNVVTIAFSPDSHWLVSASLDQTARLWDLSASDPSTSFIELVGHTKAIQAVAVSPDSHWLATAGIDFSVRMWDLRSKNPAEQSIILEGHTKNILGLAFSPDSNWLASGSVDSTVRLWNLSQPESGIESQVLSGPENFNFRSLVFTPDNHWLAAGGDFTEGQMVSSHIYLWRVSPNSSISTPRIIAAHDGYTKQIAISPDGRWLASSSWNGSSRLWEMSALDSLSVEDGILSSPIMLRPLSGSINLNVVSPDGRWLAKASGTSEDGTGKNDIYLWPLDQITNPGPTQNLIQPLKLSGHTRGVNSIAFSGDNHWLASASSDQTVRLWDLTAENIAVSSVVYKHAAQPVGVLFSPDNRWLAFTSYGKEVYLLDLIAPKPQIVTLAGGDDDFTPWAIAFSHDGQWIAAGTLEGSAYVWKMPPFDQTKPYTKLIGHSDEITKLIFWSEGGDRIITSSADTTVRIWTVSEEPTILNSLILREHTGPILTMDLSNDNRWLATGGTDLIVHLWDLTNIDLMNRSFDLSGHTDWVLDTEFSHDSQQLVTTGLDGTIRLWDLTVPNPGNAVINLPGSTPIARIAISPDDNWLVTSNSSGEVYNTLGNIRNTITTTKIWSLNLEHLIELACQVSGRNLTYSEWQEYFPDEEYRLTCQSNPIHPSIRTRADQLIMRGEIAKGEDLLIRANALDPSWNLDIEAEVLRFRVYGLLREVRNLAQIGDIQGANEKFEEAAKLDPSLSDIYNDEINRIAGAAIRRQIEVYINQQNYSDAIAYLTRIAGLQQFTSDLPQLWNMVCWAGGLNNHASDVLVACEQAVALDPYNPDYRDSRGLVRALLGDKNGAIEDFSYFVEWVYSSESLLREKWVSDLKAGVFPFDEDTLAAIGNGTYALPELPNTTQTLNSNGVPKIEIVNLPDGLKVEFPAFLQCRANKDTDQTVDDFIGILAVRTLRADAWVDKGLAQITLKGESGKVIDYYPAYFQFGPEEVGWLIPEANSLSATIGNSETRVDKISIEFLSVQWRPAFADPSQYQVKVEFKERDYFGGPQFPRNQFLFHVHNQGASALRDLTMFGVLLDKQGNTIDVLTVDPSSPLQPIQPNMSVDYTISSLSQSGRCIGPRTSTTYKLHYWVTFMTEDNQRLTQHYTMDLP